MASGTEPRVSIVVPVFNKVEFTQQCVDALAANTPEGLFELVVVDNASSDATSAFLAGLCGPVRVISNRENQGFVGACNQGAQVSRGEFVLFLNNDTAVQPGWLEALLAVVDADPEVGAVGARLVYPDGRLQEAGGLIFQDGSGWNFGRGDPEPFRERYNVGCEVDYCSGAALLVRRALFEQLGGFDVLYAPAYYEDTDLCFSLRKLGKKVWYCPASVVVHFEGVTAGTSTASGFKRYQAINKTRFMAKWKDELRLQGPSPSVTGIEPVSADRRARAPVATSQETDGIGPPVARHGRTILVVDPILPVHDQASGSLRLFRILQILVAEGWSVTFISRFVHKGKRYIEELKSMGIEVAITAAHSPADYVSVLGGPRFDVAWIDFYTLAEVVVPLLRRMSPATQIVIDTIDVHFLRERRGAELSGDSKARLAALRTKDRELAIYKKADVVVTVTDADRQTLRDAGLRRPIEIVPNIHPTAPPTPGRAGRKGLVFVGNFNHPPNVDAMRWFVPEVLPLIRARRPDAVLSIVGSNAPKAIQELAGPGVNVLGWVPSTAPVLDAAAISVAPLRYGAGMKGKVGEALGRGLPVVTTRIGAEGMGLEDGRHVLVADEASEFAAAVLRLLEDDQLWGTLAQSGKAHVGAGYSIEAVRAQIGKLLGRPCTQQAPCVDTLVGATC